MDARMPCLIPPASPGPTGPGSVSADPPAAAAAEPLIKARLTSLGSALLAQRDDACARGQTGRAAIYDQLLTGLDNGAAS